MMPASGAGAFATPWVRRSLRVLRGSCVLCAGVVAVLSLIVCPIAAPLLPVLLLPRRMSSYAASARLAHATAIQRAQTYGWLIPPSCALVSYDYRYASRMSAKCAMSMAAADVAAVQDYTAHSERSLTHYPLLVCNLPIVDEECALEQCADWSFFVELVEDLLLARERRIHQLHQAMLHNDHHSFQQAAISVMECGLDPYLPALIDAGTKASWLAKLLQRTPQAGQYLAMRRSFIDHITIEFARLEAVIPAYRRRGINQLEAQAAEMEDAAKAEFHAVEKID